MLLRYLLNSYKWAHRPKPLLSFKDKSLIFIATSIAITKVDYFIAYYLFLIFYETMTVEKKKKHPGLGHTEHIFGRQFRHLADFLIQNDLYQ